MLEEGSSPVACAVQWCCTVTDGELVGDMGDSITLVRDLVLFRGGHGDGGSPSVHVVLELSPTFSIYKLDDTCLLVVPVPSYNDPPPSPAVQEYTLTLQ